MPPAIENTQSKATLTALLTAATMPAYTAVSKLRFAEIAMQIDLPEQTAREVAALLAKRGETADVSTFVNETVQRALYFEQVQEVKRQNEGVDPTTLQAEIAEAVESARAAN